MTEDLFADHGSTKPPEPTAKKAPKLYPIYADARRATCTGKTCGQTVYWDARYKFPVSADCDGGVHPAPGADGVGVSHFSNCPDVRSFSGRGKRGG